MSSGRPEGPPSDAAEDEGETGERDRHTHRLRTPSRACSTRPGRRPCSVGDSAGMVGGGSVDHAARHHGRDDSPLSLGGPRHRSGSGWATCRSCPTRSPRGGRAQRRPPAQGGRRRGGQARGAAPSTPSWRTPHPHRHPGDGAHRPDAAVVPRLRRLPGAGARRRLARRSPRRRWVILQEVFGLLLGARGIPRGLSPGRSPSRWSSPPSASAPASSATPNALVCYDTLG